MQQSISFQSQIAYKAYAQASRIIAITREPIRRSLSRRLICAAVSIEANLVLIR
jgi:hypothetical protein